VEVALARLVRLTELVFGSQVVNIFT
jgi:hypothetical protein